MIQKIKFLPLLLLLTIGFSSCEFMVSRKTTDSHDTVPPEFRTSRTQFQTDIASITSSEEVNISTAFTQTSGEPGTHSLTITILNPTSFPDAVSFLDQSEEIKEETLASVKNIGKYQKIYIDYEQKSSEDGIEKTRSFKKEIQL